MQRTGFHQNLSGLHSPHLRHEGIVLLLVPEPTGGVIYHGGWHGSLLDFLCVSQIIFRIHHHVNTDVICQCDKDCSQEKITGLTALQPWFQFLRCHYNKCYGQRFQFLIYIYGRIHCSRCNSMRTIFLLIQLSHKKVLPWFLSCGQMLLTLSVILEVSDRRTSCMYSCHLPLQKEECVSYIFLWQSIANFWVEILIILCVVFIK